MEEKETIAGKSKKDEWLDRLRSKHPDREYASDDDFYTSALEDQDQLEKDINDRKGKDQSLVDLISERPQLGALLANLKDMKDPEAVTKLLGMYGEDFQSSIGNEEALKAMAEAQSERMEKDARNKAFSDKCEKDFEERLDMISSFCDSKGLSEDDATKFIGSFLDFCYRGTTSQFEESDLEAFHKGTNYDNDIQEAENKGKIKGANEKIELKKKESAGGDVPSLASQRTNSERKAKADTQRSDKSNLELSGYIPGKRH